MWYGFDLVVFEWCGGGFVGWCYGDYGVLFVLFGDGCVVLGNLVFFWDFYFGSIWFVVGFVFVVLVSLGEIEYECDLYCICCRF